MICSLGMRGEVSKNPSRDDATAGMTNSLYQSHPVDWRPVSTVTCAMSLRHMTRKAQHQGFCSHGRPVLAVSPILSPQAQTGFLFALASLMQAWS